MKALFKYIIITVLLLGVLCTNVAAEGYLYNQDGKDVAIPDAYQYVRSLSVADENGQPALTPQDMSVDKDGRIFVADTGNSRVFVIQNGKTTVLNTFTMSDGSLTMLSAPEGICALSKGEFLVADTKNNRILQCDVTGAVKRVIDKPDNMPGVAEEDAFLPIKVSVDSIGRLYIVARNINRGLICTNSEGDFIGYVGAPRVTPSFLDLLWRRFSTKAQLEQMTQYVSTEYNNVFVDGENFVWDTISALSASDIKSAISGGGNATPVVKINAADYDVLKRNGVHPPVGDIRFDSHPSQVVDIAKGENGVYSLLDYQEGHIFTYDDNGNLLFVFGEIGNKEGNLKLPTAIHGNGSELWVLDTELSEILIYEPTAYGNQVLSAVSAQYNGDYDSAYVLWQEVARSNSNFEYAFIGMGNAFMSDGKYDQAMDYFKYAEDHAKYSEAFALKRQQILEEVFPYIFVPIICIAVAWALYTIIARIVRYVRGVPADVEKVRIDPEDRKGLWGKFRYAGYLTTHPFKGFWEIKNGKMGSMIVSLSILALMVIANVADGLYSGYLFNANGGVHFNVPKSIATTVLLFALWCISNWCLTCLFDGEGNFVDIVRATGYALLPMAVIQVILVPLSNILSLREAAFVTFLSTLGLLWSGFLLFISVVTTHQYTFFKTVVMIICVILGMCILAYIALLLFNLIQQIVGFAVVLMTEMRGKL